MGGNEPLIPAEVNVRCGVHLPQFGADRPNVGIRFIRRMEGTARQRRLTSLRRSFESSFHCAGDLRVQRDVLRSAEGPIVEPLQVGGRYGTTM
jgi:hypothetical protein